MTIERRREIWKRYQARLSVDVLYPETAQTVRGGSYRQYRRRNVLGRMSWRGLVNSPSPSALVYAERGTQQVDDLVSLEWGAPAQAGDVLRVIGGKQYEVLFADTERDGARIVCECRRIEDVEIIE